MRHGIVYFSVHRIGLDEGETACAVKTTTAFNELRDLLLQLFVFLVQRRRVTQLVQLLIILHDGDYWSWPTASFPPPLSKRKAGWRLAVPFSHFSFGGVGLEAGMGHF